LKCAILIVLDKEDYFFKEFVIDLIKKHFDNQAVVSDKVTSEQGTGNDFLTF